jgi:type I restriction enzyme R subunit
MGFDMKAELTEKYLVEQPAINWLEELGYNHIEGSKLSPEEGERESYKHVVLKKRFITAIKRINPWLTDGLAEEVYRKVLDLDPPDFLMKGKNFYEYLIKGVKISFKQSREEETRIVRLIDFENPENNEFLVANQFTVESQYESRRFRRPDMVVFVNGLPIAIFEFKSFNSNETAKDAYNDLKIKMKDIPQLYVYSQILVASDGLETKYGSPTSDWDRFFVWEGMLSDDDVMVREIEEGHFQYIYNEQELTSLEVLLKGLFRKELEYIEDFILYERFKEAYEKRIAMYHQFYPVRKAVERTVKCVLEGKTPEERRIGVVWHTQGSGKSLTMLFYARKVLKVKALENPLILFITDRRNLDEQLYELFSFMPIVKHAESISELQDLLRTSAGGIIFATIQKFGKNKEEEYPFLTDRRNIIVVADEAHRSQYRELAQNLRKALPNASFMGFTATPIELQDRNTYLVFGDPISVYSMDKAVKHRVIVPIYYEARLSELYLTNEFIDEEFEAISEFMEEEEKERLMRKFARLERLILNPDRLQKIAKDIVEHFNKRTQEIEGKAMVVTISREAAVKLYEEIIKQKDRPSVAVVISGNKTKDPPEFWQHIRNKNELEVLLSDFKNPERDPKMVIVVDMLLTGFDVPCLHTMYFDKPMKDHSLFQAIARVNRVFKDKPGGLIVDYIGIADNLKKSLSKYTIKSLSGVIVDIDEIIKLLREKYDVIASYFSGVDYANWDKLSSGELAELTASAYTKIASANKKEEFLKNFIFLKKLYLLASPHPETVKIKSDIRFFEIIKKMVIKYSVAKTKEISRELEYEINQIISRSISAEEPMDIFALRESEKPEISILDEDFIKQFRDMEYKDYAADVLLKIMRDRLRVMVRKNPYRYKSFYELLEDLIEKYNDSLITTANVMEELVNIAKAVKIRWEEGKNLNMSEEELALYDLLSSKIKFFQNSEEIKTVSRILNEKIKSHTKFVDWNRKESLRARIRKDVKEELMGRVNPQMVDYTVIDCIASKILTHAERLYVH